MFKPLRFPSPSPSRARRARKGAAAVEFALTAPLMILVLLGTIEYGNFFSQLAMVTASARDAARYGSNQTTGALARNQAAAAARVLLTDVGFDCADPATCFIETTIVQRGGVNMIEVYVDLDYEQLTNAIPRIGNSESTVGLPTRLRSRVLYPLVGP